MFICVSVDFSTRVQSRPGDSPRLGRVEILNNGEWGLICADGWDLVNAFVVCQETELGINGTATKYLYDDQVDTLWLSGVNCMGNESHLSLCPHTGIGVLDECEYVAGVECLGKICTSIRHSSLHAITYPKYLVDHLLCMWETSHVHRHDHHLFMYHF